MRLYSKSIHILKFFVSYETLHKINPLPWKERLRENYFSKFEMDYHFKKFEFHMTYFKYWRQGYDNDRRDLRSWFISSLFFCLKSVSQQSFNPILHTTIVSCSIIQTNTLFLQSKQVLAMPDKKVFNKILISTWMHEISIAFSYFYQ